MKTKEIIAKYPELFGEPPFDPRKNLIAFGFECDEGWFPLLEETFAKISTIVKRENIEDFRFVQIKEKFGTLRLYTRGSSTEEIEQILHEAEAKSGTICEKCGAPATTEWGGWVTTLCENCKKHP